MRKKFLEKRMARLLAKRDKLVARSEASENVSEVRAINETLAELSEEIAECREELDAIAEEEKRSADPVPPADAAQRGGTPIAAYAQAVHGAVQRTEQPYSSMEYRTAFMAYVQKGTSIPADVAKRAAGDAGTTVTADIGAIVPQTIMDEFIRDVSKVYGQVYSKVRKLNIPGGVKFPVEKLGASVKWINETEVSGKQKAGDIKDFVEFSYNTAEIRMAQSLLSQVVSLDVFEPEIARIMVEAYIRAMDSAIVSGTGNGQPLGITRDPRVTNAVTFTDAQIADWTAWRKNFFAKIPLSKRGRGEFLFTASTVEGCLMTMQDKNGRPLFREAAELSMNGSGIAGRFFGRDVTLVEPDILADFDTAAAGDVIGVYWVPGDYAVNTNLVFGMKRYFDDDTNEWINKGLTIVDGRILDPTGCWLIKKSGAGA